MPRSPAKPPVTLQGTNGPQPTWIGPGPHAVAGIETLRRAVRLFDACNESFNYRYSAADLLKIAEVHSRCDFDFYPDRWTAKQISQAIKYGTVPQWDNEDRPIVRPDREVCSE